MSESNIVICGQMTYIYMELSKFSHDFTQRLTFSSCQLEFIISISTYILHGHDGILTCLFMCCFNVFAIDAT